MSVRSIQIRLALLMSVCLVFQGFTFGGNEVSADSPPSANLLANAGFETVTNGAPSGWTAIGNTWTGAAAAVPEAARTGDYGISIQTNTANNPWVQQGIPVEEEATYKISSWFKAIGVSGAPGYKIEFYTSQVVSPQTALPGYSYRSSASGLDGQWHELDYEVKAPIGAKYMYVYLRLYGTGKVYFDDAAVAKTKDAPQIVLTPNHTYYYPDLASGSINVVLKPQDGIFTGKTADIKLMKEADGTVVFAQTGAAAAAELNVPFQPSVMEHGQPYVLSAELKNAVGVILSREERTIYRWNRPTMLPQNGPVQVGGQPFFPVIAYHAGLDDLPYLSQIGVNTIQGINTASEATVQTLLDTAQANGLMVLQTLYLNMQVKENFALTEQMVARFKNHPALLGWMIMDEPTGNGIPQSEILEAYKRIRSIDSDHPTYMVESETYAYRPTGQATDILVTDVYPYNRVNAQPISAVGDGVRKAVLDTEGVKPVWTILQTFLFPGSTSWDYLPTIGQVRNMAYQSILAGSKGLGYYSINDPGWKLRESVLWTGLAAFKDELPLIGELVSQGSKTAEQIGSAVQWGLWNKGQEQYAVAINVTNTTQSAEIPLASAGNRVQLMYGGEPASWGSWNGKLNADLGPEQALVYRITPFNSEVAAAIDAIENANDMLQSNYWRQKSGDLAAKLADLHQSLAGQTPDVKHIINKADKVLDDTKKLKAWVNGQNDTVLEGKRGTLLSLLDGIYDRVVPIVHSTIRLELEPFPLAAAPGEQVTANVQIRNKGDKTLRPWLRVDLPDEFGLAPIEREFGPVNSGDADSASVNFTILSAVPAGDYTVTASVYYEFKGSVFQVSSSRELKVTPLLQTKLTPGTIEAALAGTYPFAVELTNGSAEPLTVELDRFVPNGLTVELASSATLAGRETMTLQGNVTIPATVTQGVYTVTIVPKLFGASYASLPLTVTIDTNLVYNGGFEQGGSSPDGWLMRSGVWEKTTAHGGTASAKLNPDAGNTWNVINTDDAKEIPVVAGHRYMLTGWVKNGSTTGSAALGIRQIDASGVSVQYNWAEAARGGDWTKVQVTFTALPQTKRAAVYFKLDQNVNGPAWVDDLEMRELP
ncbi:carbohydrate binding domain-containing protein [Paenibacillus sp. GCM10012303]|uniref:carbohydrate binding domain-containing protein n=1 Tax=Paenibacillus sp. GCM10012303 TaxID=3317340 RepID=UPI003610330E